MEHMSVNITPIAYIQSPFLTKFGIPRQSGLTPSVTSRIVFRKDFASEEAVRGLSDFSHIWLIWGFSENQQKGWRPTVRPPRLGGNTRVGVFATRSPFRPNGLGLSSVKLEAIEKDPRSGLFILISGADLLDGTPIYDIKPLSHVPTELQAGLLEILAQDPRPGYQDDPHRIYGLIYSNFNVQFTVANQCLRVVDIVLADTL